MISVNNITVESGTHIVYKWQGSAWRRRQLGVAKKDFLSRLYSNLYSGAVNLQLSEHVNI